MSKIDLLKLGGKPSDVIYNGLDSWVAKKWNIYWAHSQLQASRYPQLEFYEYFDEWQSKGLPAGQELL